MSCFAFSLDQLLVIGTRAFAVGGLSESFKLVPRRYAGIGLGRLIAAVEGMMGLVLFVTFVHAFLRTL